MDPNEALAEIRRLLKVVLDDSEESQYVDTGDCLDLANQVRDLDDWIKKGGFVPLAWARPSGHNPVVMITNAPGEEGAQYTLTLPDGRQAVIGEAQDDYAELAAIIDEAFPVVSS